MGKNTLFTGQPVFSQICRMLYAIHDDGYLENLLQRLWTALTSSQTHLQLLDNQQVRVLVAFFFQKTG